MRIIAPQPTSDGWWPRISPDGRFVAYGNVHTWLTDLREYERNPTTATKQIDAPMNEAAVAILGWYSTYELVLMRNTNVSAPPWIYDTRTGIIAERPDLGNIVASFYESVNGHIGFSLASGNFPLTWDGHQLLEPGYGVSVNGPWMAAGNPVNEAWNINRFYNGKLHSTVQPQVSATFFSINERGEILYGYLRQFLSYPDGTWVEATTTPWRSESIGISLYVDDELWIFQGFENNGRWITSGRRLKDDPLTAGIIEIPVATARGFSHAPNLSVVWTGTEFVAAMADDKGRMAVAMFRKDEPRTSLQQVLPVSPFPMWDATFFQFSDQYGDSANYPASCTIVAENSEAHVLRAAAKMPIIITPTSMKAATQVRDRVLAIYIGDTNGWENAEAKAKEVKQQWKSYTGLDAIVAWYITPGEPDRPGFQLPPSVDWLMPEFYFTDSNDLTNQTWRKLGWWISKIGRTKPWFPVYQAFDRSGKWSEADMKNLSGATSYFYLSLFVPDSRVGKLPNVIGMAWFAVMRPGGTHDYPFLEPIHRAIYEAIPGVPAWPHYPEPLPERPRVTIESFTPISGIAPLSVNVRARISGGPANYYEWRYFDGTWRTDSRQNPTDLDHVFVFHEPGMYQLRAYIVGPGGTDETGTRVVNVTESEPERDIYPVKPYEVTMDAETVGIIGPAGKFGRIDPSNINRILFDRTTIGSDEQLELTKPTDKFMLRFVGKDRILNLAPKWECGTDLNRQFETRSPDAWGHDEQLTVVELVDSSGKPNGQYLGYVEHEEDGRRYTSAPVTIVKV